MKFRDEDINVGDVVQIRYESEVTWTGTGEFEVIDGSMFGEADDPERVNLNVQVIKRGFPQTISSVIAKSVRFSEIRYVLAEDGKWIDLKSKVAYTVDDLGDRNDYEIIYLAEEY